MNTRTVHTFEELNTSTSNPQGMYAGSYLTSFSGPVKDMAKRSFKVCKNQIRRMPHDKLVPYWVRVRPRKKQGRGSVTESDYFNLTSFSEENDGFTDYNSYIDFLRQKLTDLKTVGYKNDTSGKTLTVRKLKYSPPGHKYSTPSGHTIEAVFGYGKFGRSADHLDSSKMDNLPVEEIREENAQDSDTSNVDRLYFFTHLSNKHPNSAFTIFHKYGNSTARTTLYQFLNESLQSLYVENQAEDEEGLMFEMNTIASKPLLEQLIEDDIQGFELVQRKVPTESYKQESEVIGNVRDAKVKVSVESKEFSFDEQGVKNLLSRIDGGDYPFAEILEEHTVDEEIDEVSAIVNTSDGRPRKRRLTRDKLTMEEYISKDIDYNHETGRPIMTSISKIARELSNEQLREYTSESLNENVSLLEEADPQSPETPSQSTTN
ncbi:hypothetical protein [Natronococcus sp. A-GB7]|uniref:hypothetical protein n=1 Tax=Natronococcus sp. A-GB7 TaxID=3037649 RepID=UPI00241CA207|nr:hypothetical protein [Natronococcus sp. A-GB7]MDG5821639.1 hypothetical protein [Natronococcus sp. A-GB7]